MQENNPGVVRTDAYGPVMEDLVRLGLTYDEWSRGGVGSISSGSYSYVSPNNPSAPYKKTCRKPLTCRKELYGKKCSGCP